MSLSAYLLPEDNNVLVVSGTMVDSIVRLGNVTTEDNDVISFVNDLCREIESLKSYPTGESLEDVKLKLPIGNASRPQLETARDVLLLRHAGHTAAGAQL